MIPMISKKPLLVTILTILMVLITVGCKEQLQKVQNQSTEDIGPSEKKVSTFTPTILPEVGTEESPVKKLSQEEKNRFVAELLRTNNHCTLPCLLGINPYETNLEEIRNMFTPYFGEGLITKDQTGSGVTFGSGFETANLIRSSFKIHLSQDEVDGIDFYLGGLWRPEVKNEDWMPFSLASVLKQLGTPSHVQFYLTEAPNEESVQGIVITNVLFYEHLEAVFIYFGQRIEEEPELRYCPNQYPPEYMVIHIGTYAETDALVGVNLEVPTSLTLEDFSNLDWDDPNTCVFLNTDAFAPTR